MSEVKFTPGPWNFEIVPCGKFQCANIGIEVHRKIASVWPIDWDEDYNPTQFPLEANARLIAAAPEMFEALQLVIGSLAFDREDATSKEVVKRINAALDKATS